MHSRPSTVCTVCVLKVHSLTLVHYEDESALGGLSEDHCELQCLLVHSTAPSALECTLLHVVC